MEEASDGKHPRGSATKRERPWAVTVRDDVDMESSHPGVQGLIDAGTKALNANRLDEAISCLCGAARANPTNGHVWMLLGIAYTRRGMVNEGLTTLATANRLDPSSANARYYLGQAYEKSGDGAGAVEQYRYALQIDPSHREAREALGTVGGGPQPSAGPAHPGTHWPMVGAGATQPQPGDQQSAAIIAPMQDRSKQRREGATRLRRGLVIGAMCFTVLMVLCFMCIPILLRSSRGSPKEVVCQYMEAKYLSQDEEVARSLTVEGRAHNEAAAELADMITEQMIPVGDMQSYTVGQPTIEGNRAQVPVDIVYIDDYGQTQEQTIDFVTVGLGPVWRVSLLQSIGGGPMSGPPPFPGDCGDPGMDGGLAGGG